MPADFGKDVSCTTSLRPGRLVSGALLVAEAAYRRLTTPPGTLRGSTEDENYGIDLAGLIGATDAAALAASLPGRIRTELLKDERISNVTATVTATTSGPAVSLDIVVVGTTDAGPFELRLAVDEVSAELLSIQESE